MADGTSVGRGVVAIGADVSNLADEVNSGVESQASSITSMFGGLGKAAGVAFAAAAAIGIGAIAGLEKIGSSFDEAFDSLRVKTGETGADLTGLETSFKNVVSNVPADFGDASQAIGDFSQKLGLTGKPLEDLAGQVLNLSRVTKTDLGTNVKATADLFNNWGTAAGDQGPKLDELFRISQATGISVSDLATQMTDGGVQFRNAGLDFEQSGALLGLLAQNGLSAADVLPALSKSMAQAAKDGKDAGTVFHDTFDAIKNAPDATTAAGIALDVFGAKAGPKFASLIREGKLSYEDLAATIAAGGDTIQAASDDTADWSEKLKLLTNKALIFLEPIATKVFNAIGVAIEWVTPFIQQFAAWLGEKLPPIIAAISGWVTGTLVPAFRSVVDWFVDRWPVISEVIGKVVDFVVNTVWPLYKAYIGFIVDVFKSAVAWVVDHWPQISAVVETVVEAVRTAIAFVVDDVIPRLVAAFEATVAWVKAHWPQIRDTIVNVFDKVSGAIESTVAFIETTWPKVQRVIAAVVDWITGTAWPVIQQVIGWIRDEFGKLVGWVQEHWDRISRVIESAWIIIRTIVTVAAAIVYGIVYAFIQTVMFIWDNFGTYIVQALKVAWDLIAGLVGAAVEVIEGIINFFADLFTGKWGKLWGDVKDIVSGVWDAIVAYVQYAVDAIGLLLEVAWTAIKLAVGLAWDAIKAAFDLVWEAIKAVVQLHIDAIKALLSLAWDAIKAAASAAWDLIKLSITVPIEAAKAALDLVWTAIKDAAGAVWSGLQTAASAAWGGIKTAIMTPINAVKDGLDYVWQLISGAAALVWDGMKTAASTAWDLIKTAIFTPIDLIKAAITGISDVIGKIWDGFESATTTVWNGVKATIGTVVDGIKATISGITGAFKAVWNAVAHAWNSSVGAFSFSIPSWVPGLGGNGFNMPDLPVLAAAGAVLRGPTSLIGGEYPGAALNPEIVTPQNIMADTFRAVMEEGWGGYGGVMAPVINNIGRDVTRADLIHVLNVVRLSS